MLLCFCQFTHLSRHCRSAKLVSQLSGGICGHIFDAELWLLNTVLGSQGKQAFLPPHNQLAYGNIYNRLILLLSLSQDMP